MISKGTVFCFNFPFCCVVKRLTDANIHQYPSGFRFQSLSLCRSPRPTLASTADARAGRRFRSRTSGGWTWRKSWLEGWPWQDPLSCCSVSQVCCRIGAGCSLCPDHLWALTCQGCDAHLAWSPAPSFVENQRRAEWRRRTSGIGSALAASSSCQNDPGSDIPGYRSPRLRREPSAGSLQ